MSLHSSFRRSTSRWQSAAEEKRQFGMWKKVGSAEGIYLTRPPTASQELFPAQNTRADKAKGFGTAKSGKAAAVNQPVDQGSRKWIIIERCLKVVNILFFASCLIVLADQTRICVDKLLNPPIASKVDIRVNESIWYPSLTICPDWLNRFKKSYVESLGMEWSGGGMVQTIEAWKKFPWGNLTLDEFWEKATWSPRDTIRDITFAAKWAGKWDNFAGAENGGKGVLERRFYNTRGQCATYRPTAEVTNNPGDGYYVGLMVEELHYTDAKYDFDWHVFLTAPGEPYLDFAMFKSLDMISVSQSTHMATAINVRIYKAIGTDESPCNDDVNYHMPACGERCLWDVLMDTNKVRCRMPWMLVDEPTCTSYQEVKNIYSLIHSRNFASLIRSRCKKCHRSCLNVRYEPNVLTRTNRDPQKYKGTAEMGFYMATNEFLYIEELEAYDITNFLGEIGGQVGFLTGWSLVSIMALIEIIFKFLKKRCTAAAVEKPVQGNKHGHEQDRGHPAWIS